MAERKTVKLDEQDEASETVQATYCLWFAWAPDGFQGPPGQGDTGTQFWPLTVDVTEYDSVTIEATGGVWSHHPGNDSDANGINNERPLEIAKYQDSVYNSQYIDLPKDSSNPTGKQRLNSLMGLLGKASPPADSGESVTPFRIGVGPETKIVGDNTRLFLGFHDGRQWSNNEGHVSVTITAAKKK